MANYLLMLFIIPGVLGVITTLSCKTDKKNTLKNTDKKSIYITTIRMPGEDKKEKFKGVRKKSEPQYNTLEWKSPASDHKN